MGDGRWTRGEGAGREGWMREVGAAGKLDNRREMGPTGIRWRERPGAGLPQRGRCEGLAPPGRENYINHRLLASAWEKSEGEGS